MEGERKQVTVLFTDVSGFTAMSSRLDPEDVHEIMDRCFEVVLTAVHRYEGTVNQFLGDGVMALFGAPIAHEDHPHRALRAALAIQRDLGAAARGRAPGSRRRVPRADRHQHGTRSRGRIGKDLRMDYTAVGDTTNLASRLLNIAEPGQIALSRPTQRLAEGYFLFEDLGDFQVERQDRGDPRLRGDRRARGPDPPRGLQGARAHAAGRARARARAAAWRAYDRAADGKASIVLLSGDPGVGKSRLLYEFMRRARVSGRAGARDHVSLLRPLHAVPPDPRPAPRRARPQGGH